MTILAKNPTRTKNSNRQYHFHKHTIATGMVTGFYIIEVVIATVILSVTIVALYQLMLASSLNLDNLYRTKQINNAIHQFMAEVASARPLNSLQSYHWSDMKEYANNSYIVNPINNNSCFNQYCSIKNFITSRIDHLHYQISQIDRNIKSAICLDKSTYSAPTISAPNCKSSGELVMKIFWYSGNEPKFIIYQIT